MAVNNILNVNCTYLNYRKYLEFLDFLLLRMAYGRQGYSYCSFFYYNRSWPELYEKKTEILIHKTQQLIILYLTNKFSNDCLIKIL